MEKLEKTNKIYYYKLQTTNKIYYYKLQIVHQNDHMLENWTYLYFLQVLDLSKLYRYKKNLAPGDDFTCGNDKLFSNEVLDVIRCIYFICGIKYDSYEIKLNHIKSCHQIAKGTKICHACYNFSKTPMVHKYKVVQKIVYLFCLFSLNISYFWYLFYFFRFLFLFFLRRKRLRWKRLRRKREEEVAEDVA